MLPHVQQTHREAAKKFLDLLKEAEEQNDHFKQVTLQRQASKLVPEILGESPEAYNGSNEVARMVATLVLRVLEAKEAA